MNTTPLESEEQKVLVEYLELKNIKFSAIPNSTFTKSWKQKMFNKAMGVRAGLPDLLLIINNKIVFIEMKRAKGSVISDYQKDWMVKLNNCEGVNVYVCYSFEEAKAVVNKLLN